DPGVLQTVAELRRDPQGLFVRGFLTNPTVKGQLDAALGKVEAAKAAIDGAVAKLNSLAEDGNLLGQWKDKTVQIDVPTYSSACIQYAYTCGAWGKLNCRCPGGAAVCLPWQMACDDVCNRWDQGGCLVSEPRVSWAKENK